MLVTVVLSMALPVCQWRQRGSAPARGIARVSHLRGRKGRGEVRGRPLMEPVLLFRRHGSLQRRRLLDQGPHLGRHHQKRGVQNQCSGGGASSARAPAHHRYAALPQSPLHPVAPASQGTPCRGGTARGSLARARALAWRAQTRGCLRAHAWRLFPRVPISEAGSE